MITYIKTSSGHLQITEEQIQIFFPHLKSPPTPHYKYLLKNKCLLVWNYFSWQVERNEKEYIVPCVIKTKRYRVITRMSDFKPVVIALVAKISWDSVVLVWEINESITRDQQRSVLDHLCCDRNLKVVSISEWKNWEVDTWWFEQILNTEHSIKRKTWKSIWDPTAIACLTVNNYFEIANEWRWN